MDGEYIACELSTDSCCTVFMIFLSFFFHTDFGTVVSTMMMREVTHIDPLVLDCAVPPSVPKAEVAWTLRGIAIDGSNSRIGVTLHGQLVFSWFDRVSDVGRARCTVSNSVTGDSAESSEFLLTNSGITPSFSFSPSFLTPFLSPSLVYLIVLETNKTIMVSPPSFLLASP